MCRKGPYDRGAINRCLAVMTRPGTGTFRRKLPLRSARALYWPASSAGERNEGSRTYPLCQPPSCGGRRLKRRVS